MAGGRKNILLLTPPMVQINTPYPATPVLSAFLKEHGIEVFQKDMSLEVALALFRRETVLDALEAASRMGKRPKELDAFLDAGDLYAENIEPVVGFLQGRSPELSWIYSRPESLPQGLHFREICPDGDTDEEEALEELFGIYGIEGKAKLRASLFLDDLASYLAMALDRDFAFAKYAEHLAAFAPSFDPVLKRLGGATYVDRIIDRLVTDAIREHSPMFAGITVPFPGTVYGAFRIAKRIKEIDPSIKTILGGGYVNSELRELSDERVFDYFDFICYDEGYAPLLGIFGLGPSTRTRTRGTSPEILKKSAPEKCAKFKVRAPDYDGLDLSRYVSMVETANPMHRLWSDGKWLKIQLTQGCYWHRCKFCDVALDYIGRFLYADAAEAVDALVSLKEKTGCGAFHFTDEAIPPKLCRDLSNEIISRGLKIVWWGNIRFDRGFDRDLALLMAKSGCIAVTGGLECANDRLLKLMDKGITLRGAHEALAAFAEASILAHVYLMYGYPTETMEETVSALDFVRRLFAEGLVCSAFWHRFALTVHSPIAADPPPGLKPVLPKAPPHGRFALNEIPFEMKGGSRGDDIGKALSLAVYNYMLGRGLDLPASFWFGKRNPRRKERR